MAHHAVKTFADITPDDVVGVCVSGGLDSKTVCTALKEGGCKVKSFSCDLGQPDEDDIQNVVARMATCGVECFIVDAKDRLAELAFEMLITQAKYDGGYWQSTGIGRVATVECLAAEMKKQGVTILSHGATGRGNDQMRFERYTNVLHPEFRVYAPWRDPQLLARFPGRKEMADYLTAKGIQAYVGPKKKYSTDSNLAGLSHEAEELEHLTTAADIVSPEMTMWPEKAPDVAVNVTIRVEKGRPVVINGTNVTPVEALRMANNLGKSCGIGLIHALENRLLGTKSRGVYEAPGMTLLGQAVEFVIQATYERRAYALLQSLSRVIADALYDARYFDPCTQAAIGACKHLAQYATGTVTVRMYKGNIMFVSLVDVPHNLYCEDDSSMERADEGLNPVSSQGYAEIQAVTARRLAWAGQTPYKGD